MRLRTFTWHSVNVRATQSRSFRVATKGIRNLFMFFVFISGSQAQEYMHRKLQLNEISSKSVDEVFVDEMGLRIRGD